METRPKKLACIVCWSSQGKSLKFTIKRWVFRHQLNWLQLVAIMHILGKLVY